MSTFLQDLRFALRTFLRTPAFPLAAIATLALGIGATTAIFSTVNAALLRPLPYPAAQDLFAIRTTLIDGRVTTGLLSPGEIIRLNDPSLSVVRAAGVIQQTATLLGSDGTPIKTQVYAVSEGFFDMFGLPLSVGPGFTHEHFVGNGPPVVVISYRVWQDMFGGDPNVVGKSIRFAQITTTVAGVAPRAFDTPHGAGFWFNLSLDPQGVNHSFDGYLRIRPGVSIDRVRSEMASVMAGLARDFPASDFNRAYVVRPLVDSIVGDLGPILVVVLSATALLLVLACVNVTNLFLARGAARAREMAVRVALGAGRGRIVRQLLTESFLLATIGALAGLLVAFFGVRMLLAVGASKLPRLEAVPFDGRVLLFALAALFVSGLFVGFAPALRLAATDVKTLMNESTRSTSGSKGTGRWLSAMTVAEIALAVMLVAGAGWLIRGFSALRTTDPGFLADGRVVFDISLQGPKYRDQATVIAAGDDLFDRLRHLAGVVGVGSTSNMPLRLSQENSVLLQLHGEPFDSVHPMGSRQRTVSPGFFDAIGITRVSGRDFTVDDRLNTARVAIVNRTFVKRYLTGKDPLTVKFAAGYPTVNPNNELTIVGVVEDVRQKTLSEAPEPAYYTSQGQDGQRQQTIVLHTSVADPASLGSAIRDEVRKTDPLIPVDTELATAIVAATLSRQQLGMTLMLLFGVAAVALAAVGIYGVIAYAASQRRAEIATRLALGSTQRSIFWLVLEQGRTLAAVGAVIGAGAAYLAGRFVSSRLAEVSTSDPSILGLATVIVVVIAIAATTIPAVRAAKIDPARVLRPD